MMDAERYDKVVEGLELCLKGLSDLCPYKDSDAPGGCRDELMYDAMVLLKVQEPVKPLKMEVEHVRKDPVVFSYQCPVCMCGLQRHWVACPICGTGVKWE